MARDDSCGSKNARKRIFATPGVKLGRYTSAAQLVARKVFAKLRKLAPFICENEELTGDIWSGISLDNLADRRAASIQSLHRRNFLRRGLTGTAVALVVCTLRPACA